MGLWSRFLGIFGAKMNKALDRMENPAETLDYSYEKQLNLLKDVRRGLAEIATSKQRLKMQADKLRHQDSKLQQQAQAAILQERDDLARIALQRRQTLQPQIQSLETQITDLDGQQAKLADASQQLQSRIEMFRTEKEAIKARYQASQAQVKIGESFTGLSKEMNSIGVSVQRAQDRIEQMEARSSALDELIESGALEDYSRHLPGEDDIDRQLRLSTGNTEIEAELTMLKQQLGQGPPQPQLGAKEWLPSTQDAVEDVGPDHHDRT